MSLEELYEYYINADDLEEKLKKICADLEQLDLNLKPISTPRYELLTMRLQEISNRLTYLQHIDFSQTYDVLKSIPEILQKSAEQWAKYDWVPYLPMNESKQTIYLLSPTSQENADQIMLEQLDDKQISQLFEKLSEKVKSHSHNTNTFEEAVKCYTAGLYSGCALLLFAIIDSCFLIGQTTEGKSKRDLAGKAVEKSFDEEKSQYVISALATRLIVEKLFEYAHDFDSQYETGVNRNFLSHGMNKYVPTQTDCLKLFVLLYNIYVSFDTKCFRWS